MNTTTQDAKFAKETRNSQKTFDLTVEDQLSSDVLNAAIEVQRELGIGLLESAYRTALIHELRSRDFYVDAEKELFATYKGVNLGLAYRADLIVNNAVVLELKTVEALLDVHRAQLLTYLRLSHCKLGLLINFHEYPIGIKRVVNKL
jgi:GxxExxY protein